MWLFVVLDPAGLDAELTQTLQAAAARALLAAPRARPDRRRSTRSRARSPGKKLEVPIKKILMGADPARVASRDSLANPAAFDAFVDAGARAGRGSELRVRSPEECGCERSVARTG